jgi:hypothetical protein
LRTDAQGQFQLTVDETVTRIVVAAPDGYAEISPAELFNVSWIQLQPWGRLEVTCFSGGEPAVGREFVPVWGMADNPDVAFDIHMSRRRTDAQGRFSIQMPPGRHRLMRLIPMPNGVAHGDKTAVEIRPGETTTLTFGASGHTARARMRWPVDRTKDEWQFHGTVRTPVPDLPPGIEENSHAAIAYRSSPEFQELVKDFRSFPLAIGADGTVSAEDIPPGNYVLILTAAPRHPTVHSVLLSANMPLSIPAEPTSGTLDLGEIILREPTR